MEGLVLAVGTVFSSFGEEKEAAGGIGRRAHESKVADDYVYVVNTLVYVGYNMDSGAGLLGSNPDPATDELGDHWKMI